MNKFKEKFIYSDQRLKSLLLAYLIDSGSSGTTLSEILETISPANSINHIENTNVTVAPVQINAASNPCKICIVTADEDNTGWIRVGGSTLTASTGIVLYAGESYPFEVNDSNLLYAAAEVAGEDVSGTYLN